MEFVEQNKRVFVPSHEHLYRRLSVRECARIQTFPDTHTFYYTNVTAGYKMVGNAVPPNLAYYLAKKIQESLSSVITPDGVSENTTLSPINPLKYEKNAS
jgi:DNA (cytosine-5)-methyltransferase 1